MRRRVLVLALASLAAVLPAGRALRASPLNDPFLERFRVGAYADADGIAVADGWPADLFAPLAPDSLGLAAASRWLAEGAAAAESSLSGAFMTAASGSADSTRAWLAARRAAIDALAAGLGCVPSAADSAGGPAAARRGPDWMLKESLYIKYQCYWNTSSYYSCRDVVTAVLRQAVPLRLSPEETFVWTLRLRRLQDLTGAPAAAPLEPWPEMLALGSYDAQSAWALWVACQRARRQPLVPPQAATAELAAWLLRLRRTWLTETDLELASFSAEATAALGALFLEPTRARADHFRRFPQPPHESRFQEAWLRGRLRALDWPPEEVERWADRPELAAAVRRQLWRRASETRLLRGEWDRGLADLRAALALPPGGAGSGEPRRRTIDWALQAVVLATAQARGDEARRLLAEVPAALTPDEREEWQAAAAGLRERLATGRPPAPAGGGDALAQARRVVLGGRAGAVGAERGEPALAALARREGEAWTAWADWGLAIGQREMAGGGGSARADYLGALAGVAATHEPQARRSLALKGAARILASGGQAWAPIGDWLLAWDLARAAGRDDAPALPPLEFLPVAGADALRRHALLGLCLAAGDGAGQLRLARGLPAAGLPAAARLPLSYPVPAAPEAQRALAAAPVDAALALAVIRNESLFDPGVRSRAGALGWMQIMPFHYPSRGLADDRPQWSRPGVSLAAGLRLLADAARSFHGDPYRTAAAYNAGAGAVRRWERQLGGAVSGDLFLAWIGYPETRLYVENVLIDREIYAWILAGRLPAGP